MEGDAQSGFRQHGQVIGPVAHGNRLRQVHVLHLGDELQQFGFAASVHDFAHVASRQFAVFNLEFVGVDVINVIFAFQVVAEISESTRKDGDFVAILFQH